MDAAWGQETGIVIRAYDLGYSFLLGENPNENQGYANLPSPPNDSFNFFFGLDRWKRNGNPVSSWEELLYPEQLIGATTEEIEEYYGEGYGPTLMSITFRPKPATWNNTDIMKLWDYSELDTDPAGVAEWWEAQQGIVPDASVYYLYLTMNHVGYLREWYGSYKWELKYVSGFNGPVLFWELSEIAPGDGYYAILNGVGEFGAGGVTEDDFPFEAIFTNQSVPLDESSDEGSWSYGMDEWLGIPTGQTDFNSQYNTVQDYVDEFPCLVDKKITGFSSPLFGLFSDQGAYEYQGDMSLLATEVEIAIYSVGVGYGLLSSGLINDNYIMYESNFPYEYDEGYNPWTFFYPNPSEEFGDFNFDENVNVLDVVALASWVLMIPGSGWPNITDEQMLNIDMNQDGSLNILDVVILVNYILGTWVPPTGE